MTMFIRYYLDLEIPFEAVESALTSSPGEWVPGLVREAGDRADRLLAEVGFDVADGRIDKRVAIGFDPPFRLPNKTLLPMSWRATGPEQLFPALEADIEVAALGPNRTQLSMSARYHPPKGAVGRVLDRMLLHRVAEATVKDFLDRVGEDLSLRIPAPLRG
jgi:hypothetical protein